MSNSTANIGGAQVKVAMSATLNASVLLQLYTQTILGTPDIKLPAQVDKDSNSKVVENLPKHQATARANANDFLKNVNPLLFAESADIVGFANLWNSEFGSLLALAKNIDQGTNRTQFQQGIENLIAQVSIKQAGTSPVLTGLNGFLHKVLADDKNFATDAKDVATAMGGESGEIAKLEAELASHDAAVAAAVGIIAAGATTDIVGGIMVAVGVFATIETEGASLALVIGGLALLSAGTAAMIGAGVELGVLGTQIAAESAKLKEDQLIYAGVQQASYTVGSLKTATSQGVTAATSLQKAWQSLKSDLEQVILQLELAQPDLGSWLENVLTSANADWAGALALAKSLQQYGSLPVTKKRVSAAA